jgi:hypothetical protein
MAMPNIHMVQRLQGRIDEADVLVVVDCYGRRKQYLLERRKTKMKKKRNKKFETSNAQYADHAKTPFPSILLLLSCFCKDNNKER